MQLLLALPGGAEWLFIVVVVLFGIVFPVLLIYFMSKTKTYKSKYLSMKMERDALLEKLEQQAK